MRQGKSPSRPARAGSGTTGPAPKSRPREAAASRSRGSSNAGQDRPRGDAASPPSARPSETRDRLLAAARAEFDEKGFEGTDTNRIARRAGFAPQTFYRHFDDKTAIFVESYRAWLDDEWKDLERAKARGADEAARITLAHHARHREFRRSLRRLTVSDAAVRAARAASRREQMAAIAEEDASRGRSRDDATRAALLLCIERIADAAADGELADLGFSAKDQAAMLADLLRRFAR